MRDDAVLGHALPGDADSISENTVANKKTKDFYQSNVKYNSLMQRNSHVMT